MIIVMYPYLVKENITITVTGANAAGRLADKRDNQVIFKNCVLFPNGIIKINNNAWDINVVMPIYNLLKYSHTYSKTLENLRQY